MSDVGDVIISRDAAIHRAAAEAALEAGAALGDGRCRWALKVLKCASREGTGAMDDAAALRDVAARAADGDAAHAVAAVARLLAGSGGNAESIGRRLRRKRKKDGQQYLNP